MIATSLRYALCAALALGLPTAAFARDAQAAPAATTDAATRFANPDTLVAPNGYSHAVSVAAGRTVYVSGQIAVNAKGELVGGSDVGAQAEQVFANLDTALNAAGASFADVVKLTIYVTDMNQIKALRAARDKRIDARRPPASTAVEVSRFVKEGVLVEVDAIAVVR